jgi:DNA repair exonuclease SbcCD nuclease subunit
MFRFIHTSDWQIGKPFRNFEDRVAGRLEGARLKSIDRIASIAESHEARHVMVAGDVYDGQSLPLKTLMQPMRRMERAALLTWWLLPGNHDPARAQGVWERVRAEGLPDNVRVLARPEAVQVEPGVFVLPAPLAAHNLADDPTAWMDSYASPAGAIRIGLAHGSIKGFGSLVESAVSIHPERAVKAKLDYLALGDWHGVAKINARTWYSGTPEPDRFPDNVPGSVLAVSVAGPGAVPEVVAKASAEFVWAKRDIEISGVEDLVSLWRDLEEVCPDTGRLVVRLRIRGRVGLEALCDVQRWCQGTEGKVEFLDPDLTGLLPLVEDDAADPFAASEELSDAARLLRAMVSSEGDPRQKAAAAALARLAALARQATLEGA